MGPLSDTYSAVGDRVSVDDCCDCPHFLVRMNVATAVRLFFRGVDSSQVIVLSVLLINSNSLACAALEAFEVTLKAFELL